MGAPVLGELPVAPGVSRSGDAGVPYMLVGNKEKAQDVARSEDANAGWNEVMQGVAERVWEALSKKKREGVCD